MSEPLPFPKFLPACAECGSADLSLLLTEPATLRCNWCGTRHRKPAGEVAIALDPSPPTNDRGQQVTGDATKRAGNVNEAATGEAKT